MVIIAKTMPKRIFGMFSYIREDKVCRHKCNDANTLSIYGHFGIAHLRYKAVLGMFRKRCQWQLSRHYKADSVSGGVI